MATFFAILFALLFGILVGAIGFTTFLLMIANENDRNEEFSLIFKEKEDDDL